MRRWALAGTPTDGSRACQLAVAHRHSHAMALPQARHDYHASRAHCFRARSGHVPPPCDRTRLGCAEQLRCMGSDPFGPLKGRTSAAKIKMMITGSCIFSQHRTKKLLGGTSLYLLGPNTRMCSDAFAGAPGAAAASRPSCSWLHSALARPGAPPRALSPSESLFWGAWCGECGCRGGQRRDWLPAFTCCPQAPGPWAT